MRAEGFDRVYNTNKGRAPIKIQTTWHSKGVRVPQWPAAINLGPLRGDRVANRSDDTDIELLTPSW